MNPEPITTARLQRLLAAHPDRPKPRPGPPPAPVPVLTEEQASAAREQGWRTKGATASGVLRPSKGSPLRFN